VEETSMVAQRRKTEDTRNFFRDLEREFESTFGELIPGIIHDFASPLNGILGRSELLGRRVEKTIKHITENGCSTDDDLLESCKKIQGDAGLLAKEVSRLFDLFNRVTEKFSALKDTAVQEISLSELVEDEMAFLGFYPGVKHDIKRKLALDRNIPEVLGVKADYSLALSAIIKGVIDSMRESESKELVVTTGCDDSHVYVRIEDTGTPVTESVNDEMLESPSRGSNGGRDPFYAMSLLKRYGVLLQMTHESGVNVTSIRVPY
jgi:signal transduction histidine kinase